jgi:uncharacterized integral membrane protein
MQLMLIAGIVFAIGAVLFALQNNMPVTVTFALWRFDSTLAVVLLLALGLGALIAALVSTPTVIRGQWGGARLRRQVAGLEEEKARLEQRVAALEAEAARLRPPAPAEAKPYAELREMLTGEGGTTTPLPPEKTP